MSTHRKTTDINGHEVVEGDIVRVLGFQDGLFNSMPEEEVMDVKSMLHEELKVEEIDENNIAWVWKSWPEGQDHCRMHGLGLEPHQMELVCPEKKQVPVNSNSPSS